MMAAEQTVIGQRWERPRPKRIIVCGGRDYQDAQRIAMVLAEYEPNTTIIHGGASGADTIVGRHARLQGMKVEVFPADWQVDHRAAGPIRNQRMVDAGADLLIAFPGGRGTRDCVRRARRAGIPVREEP